jgi:hypothetical protein
MPRDQGIDRLVFVDGRRRQCRSQHAIARNIATIPSTAGRNDSAARLRGENCAGNH